MRHEDRQIGFGQDLSGCGAEDQLPQTALRIATFDQEIGAERSRGFEHGGALRL
jgi:hypothetical protein